LIWSKEKYTTHIASLNLNFDTEMTWACPESYPERFILYDLYKIKYDWPLNGTMAGYWSPDEGLRIVLTQYKYGRRQDMRGAVFTGGLVVS
jgi:hypothetical protein